MESYCSSIDPETAPTPTPTFLSIPSLPTSSPSLLTSLSPYVHPSLAGVTVCHT